MLPIYPLPETGVGLIKDGLTYRIYLEYKNGCPVYDIVYLKMIIILSIVLHFDDFTGNLILSIKPMRQKSIS